MENSQVQNDLKRKFFVVLIMLGVFFGSDAFCHEGDSDHTHTGCPEGPIDTPIDTPIPLETILHYPECFFIAPGTNPPPTTTNPQPGNDPQQRQPQTPDPDPRQPQQQQPQQQQTQTPDPDPRQPQQRQTQTLGTNPPPATTNPQSTQIVPTGINPQPVANRAQRSAVATSPLKDILITEYMLLDWSVGNRGLPQWIELYNPNKRDVDITGYKFYYAEWNRRTSKYEINDTPITLEITIPAEDAIIIATHKRRRSTNPINEGIVEEHVFVLDIANVLKTGWKIVDTDGDVVHEIGTLFTNGLIRDPELPKHVEGTRQSFKRYASETSGDDHYYGHWRDIGSPGFYREETVPAAPTLLKKRLLNTSWASLRKRR